MNETTTKPVLIVEDDETTAELEKRALIRSGKTARTAQRVDEAIALLRQEKFSAVLLDYRLQDGVAWPILDAIQSLVPRVPVIIVTGAGDERVASEAIRRGAAEYLIKTDTFVEQLPGAVDIAIKLAEAENAKALLAAIVESSDDAILGGSLEHVFNIWNRGAERIYGYSAEEVLGQSMSILLPSDRSNELPTIFNRILRCERVENLETVHLRKDGIPIHVSITVSPILDTGGRMTGFSVIARDITELKQKNEDLERFHRLSVGRELEMIQLKEQVNRLLIASGKPPQYKIPKEAP